MSFTENFDNVESLFNSGWIRANNSNPLGTSSWLQADSLVFSAQSGTPESYVAANYESVDTLGSISTWLITPVLNLDSNQTISFYTRTTTSNSGIFLDRLQVRLSLNGASSDIGNTADSVGYFTTILFDINPSLTPTGYPTTFTKFDTPLSGVFSPPTGRIAFRYFIPTDAGSSGNNGNYIGIDTFSYNSNDIPPTNVDLSVIKTDNPDPVIVGNNLTYTVTVTNTSTTDAATNVVLTDTLPAGVTFGSAIASQGNASAQNGIVTANFGTIPANGTATATIVVTPTATGSITNTASVSATQPDPNTTNNTSTQSTTVNLVPNDIRLAIAAKDANKLEGNTGNTPFIFTATRTGDTSIVTTANWAVTGAATNPANATDFAGGTLPNGTVSFGIGETTNEWVMPFPVNIRLGTAR